MFGFFLILKIENLEMPIEFMPYLRFVSFLGTLPDALLAGVSATFMFPSWAVSPAGPSSSGSNGVFLSFLALY